MDKYDVIDKARNALIQHLSNNERLMFTELTPEHQRYLVSWEARYLDNECPDGVSIEDCIQQDIDGCIGHLKNTIGKLMNTDEGKEQWEEWLGLKTRIRDVLEVDQLVRLLFHPFEIKATGKKKGMHYFAGVLLAHILPDEGYIEPYRYPWETGIKNIIFREAGLDFPNMRELNTQRDREHEFARQPIQIKIHALIKINDLEATAKKLPSGGWLHPARMVPVWRSYIPTFTAEILLPSSPDIETSHPGNTKPKRQTRERLKILCKCHDGNLSIEEILSKCKHENHDLFDKYTLDTFSKGTGNLWQLAQGYRLIPKRK